MSTILRKPLPRRLMTAERLIAGAAILMTVAGFAQPQIMALAGLGFDRSSRTLAAGETDPQPTGSIRTAATAPSNPIIHGLAGALRPLRGRD
jgi:hypothetical protein